MPSEWSRSELFAKREVKIEKEELFLQSPVGKMFFTQWIWLFHMKMILKKTFFPAGVGAKCLYALKLPHFHHPRTQSPPKKVSRKKRYENQVKENNTNNTKSYYYYFDSLHPQLRTKSWPHHYAMCLKFDIEKMCVCYLCVSIYCFAFFFALVHNLFFFPTTNNEITYKASLPKKKKAFI